MYLVLFSKSSASAFASACAYKMLSVTLCCTVCDMGKYYSNVIPSITGLSPTVGSNGSSRVGVFLCFGGFFSLFVWGVLCFVLLGFFPVIFLVVFCFILVLLLVLVFFNIELFLTKLSFSVFKMHAMPKNRNY